MATTQISTGLYLDKRRETEQGTYPIKVSVSINIIENIIQLVLYTTIEDCGKCYAKADIGKSGRRHQASGKTTNSERLFFYNARAD